MPTKIYENLNDDEVYSHVTKGKFKYFNTVTRENWERKGRITEWIKNNRLWEEVKKENFHPELDRVMICGSEEMTYELKEVFESLGSKEGQQKFKVDL